MTTPAAAPAPGTPEYNAAMAAAYEGQNKGEDPNKQSFTPAPAAKPEWLPEKFWDAKTGAPRYEDLAKSYTHLESKQGAAPAAAAPKAGETIPEPGEAAAADAAKAAGLDWTALQNEVIANGTLSEEQFKALETKSGIPREVAEDYVKGLVERRAANIKRTEDFVGGKDVLKQITDRASKELTAEERAMFNAQLANEGTYQAALTVLKTRFAPTDGEPTGSLDGSGTGASGGLVGFASAHEQTDAINAKDAQGRRLYDVDPAYRAKVRQRIMLTK